MLITIVQNYKKKKLNISIHLWQKNQGDWYKLKKLMGFLKYKQEDVLTFEVDDRTTTITWHIDAAFASIKI